MEGGGGEMGAQQARTCMSFYFTMNFPPDPTGGLHEQLSGPNPGRESPTSAQSWRHVRFRQRSRVFGE